MKDPMFALNRITLPGYSLEEFFRFAAENSFAGVELRNDLPARGITDGYTPQEVRTMSRDCGVPIISINALQRFNEAGDRLDGPAGELERLVRMAEALDCRGIVLCPVNDAADGRSEAERRADTVRALRRFGPIFADAGIRGWIEPLGFPQSSLRLKEDAAAAIDASGFSAVYGIVHDTFHHYLSGERKVFPDRTELVHVSGVERDGTAAEEIADADRVLVTVRDIMENIPQIMRLRDGNYEGFFSFECFSPAVRAADIAASRDYLAAASP